MGLLAAHELLVTSADARETPPCHGAQHEKQKRDGPAKYLSAAVGEVKASITRALLETVSLHKDCKGSSLIIKDYNGSSLIDLTSVG